MHDSPTPPNRVSEDLRQLHDMMGPDGLTVAEILTHTKGRGLQTMAIVLCLPFLSPVSVPGLSIPFGVAIAICGLRIALRREPWLPGFATRRKIPAAILDKVLRFGIAVHVRMEKFLRPRWSVIAETHSGQIAAGLAIALSAFFLSLPIPPPFPLTNTIPGFAIILICLGMLERDGLVIFCGWVLTVIAAIYVALIAFLGTEGAAYILRWLKTVF